MQTCYKDITYEWCFESYTCEDVSPNLKNFKLGWRTLNWELFQPRIKYGENLLNIDMGDTSKQLLKVAKLIIDTDQIMN